MTRKEKRNKKINIINEIIQIITQYFPKLTYMFNNVEDCRNQSYVKYEMKVIFIVRLMGLICGIKSMNEITSTFNTDIAIDNIAKISELELEEIPHIDTINNIFKEVKVSDLEEINRYIIKRLIESKIASNFKVRNKYYHVVIDGTGLATSRKRYNKNCLKKNKTDKHGEKYTEYSTYVLEAKLILGDMVFSIGSEFVENVDTKTIKGYQEIKSKRLKAKEKIKQILINKSLEKQKYKQDCEIKAFKRLAEKIKKGYPRLNIVISGDSLYAANTVLEICREYNWKYIIRFKEGSIPTLYKEFETIVAKSNEINKEDYEVVTNIDYKENKINIIRYTEKKKKDNASTVFAYITDLPISNKNVESTIVLGRARWKIENEGFNMQKNQTFDIGHLYSRNSNAIKIHYLMIQIAHSIRTLLEKGSKKIKEFKLKIKEISFLIKKELISSTIDLKSHNKMQLRFIE